MNGETKGCMQHVVRLGEDSQTAFIYLFFSFPPFRLRGDHQRRQHRTQINYDLEDDPTPSDFDCVFLSRPPAACVCVHLLFKRYFTYLLMH